MPGFSLLSDLRIINDPLSSDGYEAPSKVLPRERAHRAPRNGLLSTLLTRLWAPFLSDPSFQSEAPSRLTEQLQETSETCEWS